MGNLMGQRTQLGKSDGTKSSSFILEVHETLRQLREKKKKKAAESPSAAAAEERPPAWPAGSISTRLNPDRPGAAPTPDSNASSLGGDDDDEADDDSLDLESDATGHQVHTEIFYESIVDGPLPPDVFLYFPQLVSSKSSLPSSTSASVLSSTSASAVAAARSAASIAAAKAKSETPTKSKSEPSGSPGTPEGKRPAERERREKSRRRGTQRKPK